MSEFTRRGFVKSTAGAAASVTVFGALAAGEAEARRRRGSKPVVAYVKHPHKGEISLMSGDREVTIRDHKLAARIVDAAR